VLGNLFAQPLSTSFLVYLLVWSPPPHIPYIASPNQCLLFATHAHTIAICFAVVSRLYHLFLVFLSTPYLELSFTLTLHIHLTILISARWSATSLSFLTDTAENVILQLWITLLLWRLKKCMNLFIHIRCYPCLCVHKSTIYIQVRSDYSSTKNSANNQLRCVLSALLVLAWIHHLIESTHSWKMNTFPPATMNSDLWPWPSNLN